MRKKTQCEVIKILQEYNLKMCDGEVYRNANTPIKCIDNEGYIVYPVIARLRQGQLPNRFGNGNRSTIENIKHYIKTRGDCKDIELVSNVFKNAKSKIIFRCKKHGEFKMTWNSFYNGCRCPKCAIENNANKQRKTQDEIIKILKEYGFKMYEGEIYKDVNSKIKCIDSEGYIVYIRIGDLQQGKLPFRFGMCNPSTIENIKHYIKITDDCNNIELISNKFKNAILKLTFKCNKHGEFKMSWNSFYAGHRCPKCNQSKGENKIEQWLKQNNINYKTQYTFENCKYKRLLPFDFYLPNYNICIEYDGEQHFKPLRYNKNKDKMLNKLKQVQKRDKIKDEYCKNNNIKLLRIPHSEFDNIENILEKFFKESNTNNNNHLTNLENMV